MGNDREALLGRRVEVRDIPHARQCHVKRARDGRGRQGQDVDLRAQRLKLFLVRDAEALFLIDHHQTQFLEPNVGRDQAVGADDDVDLAAHKSAQDRGLFARGPEARKHLHLYGEGGQAL